MCGFLQGHSYSPVRFCLSEVPICILPSETREYRMGPPGQHKVKQTHGLFIDDLKAYKESHELLSATNKMIIKATGACYRVKKCAEIVFKHGKMVKGDGMEQMKKYFSCIIEILLSLVYSRVVLMVVCWHYRMPFDANGCISTLVNVS